MNGPGRLPRAAAELVAAYGRLPQLLGVSVDDMDAYQADGAGS